jgi:hypothetical protein
MLLSILSISTVAEGRNQEVGIHEELIVIAAPISGDPNYEDIAEDILNFHVKHVWQIESRDDVLVLVDEEAYQRYVEVLGEDRIVLAPILGIWIRDFSL